MTSPTNQQASHALAAPVSAAPQPVKRSSHGEGIECLIDRACRTGAGDNEGIVTSGASLVRADTARASLPGFNHARLGSGHSPSRTTRLTRADRTALIAHPCAMPRPAGSSFAPVCVCCVAHLLPTCWMSTLVVRRIQLV